jgi:hypothetical protein
MRLIFTMLGGGLAVYAGLALYLYLFQGQFVYFPEMPSRVVAFTPKDAGLGYESVQLQTEDGETLAGWFVPAATPKGSVLYLHGNGGNIGHRIEMIEIFHRLGLNVLIFDYRGYGESTGHPTEEGTYRDALAGWRYLTETRHIPAAELYYFGESLGGSIASWLAERHPPKAMVLYATFTSIEDMARKLYPFMPARLLARFRYDTKNALTKVLCPVFIMHSPEDEIVPYAHAKELLAVVQRHKQLVPLIGGHNDALFISLDIYSKELEAFLQKVREEQ